MVLQSLGNDRIAPTVHLETRADAQASRARNGSRSGTEQPRDDQSSVSNKTNPTINHDPADDNESDNYPNDDALDAAPCRSSARRDYNGTNSSQEERSNDASYPTTPSPYPHSTRRKPRYSKSVSDQVMESLSEAKNEPLDIGRKKLALSEKKAEKSLRLMDSTVEFQNRMKCAQSQATKLAQKEFEQKEKEDSWKERAMSRKEQLRIGQQDQLERLERMKRNAIEKAEELENDDLARAKQLLDFSQ
jgi:hypothetical protein